MVLLSVSLPSLLNFQSCIDNLSGYEDYFNGDIDSFYLITGKCSSENVSISPCIICIIKLFLA